MPQFLDEWNERRPGDLPGDLSEIAEGCGAEVAEQLLARWDELTAAAPDDVARAVGMEVARYLLQYWGGVTLYIPSLAAMEKAWVDEQILKEWNGQNLGALAKRYQRNRRYVRELLRDRGRLRGQQGLDL